MRTMKTLLVAGAIAGVGLASGIPAAEATVLNTTFGVSVYNFTCPNCTIGSASQQALPSNPDITAGNLLYSGSYNGAMNFSPSTDTIGAFFASGGGTLTPGLTTTQANTTLSSGSYNGATNQVTSLMKFTFAIGSSMEVILHDDGVSLYDAGDTTTDLLPIGDSAPTTATDADITLAAGSYDLYYVEANGLPADLTFNTTPTTAVPEPATLAVLGLGLLGLGVVRRRAPRA